MSIHNIYNITPVEEFMRHVTSIRDFHLNRHDALYLRDMVKLTGWAVIGILMIILGFSIS